MEKRFFKLCPCGNELKILFSSQMKRKKYCCLICKYKYITVKPNLGQFKKGEHKSISTQFKSGGNKGILNNKWKGDQVGYFALHTWVQRTLGKAITCEWCNNTKGRIEWANKSHKYIRDINDWISLCKKCHVLHDKNHWGLATKKFLLNV